MVFQVAVDSKKMPVSQTRGDGHVFSFF